MKYEQIIQTIKSDRMDDAVAAAAQLYLEKGIDEVKMTEIAQKCGLGVASLYRYFGTKQNLTVKAGAYIWKQKLEQLEYIFSSESYRKMTGIDQIAALWNVFLLFFTDHTSFLRFIAEFDTVVVRDGLTAQQLEEYEKKVLNVMPIMEKAFQKGLADGTVRNDISLPVYYFTASHALMSLCQKFARGRIFASDDPAGYQQELQLAIDIFVSYVRA